MALDMKDRKKILDWFNSLDDDKRKILKEIFSGPEDEPDAFFSETISTLQRKVAELETAIKTSPVAANGQEEKKEAGKVRRSWLDDIID